MQQRGQLVGVPGLGACLGIECPLVPLGTERPAIGPRLVLVVVNDDVRPSVGSVGDCYDNALCESFFATLECELFDQNSFRTDGGGA